MNFNVNQLIKVSKLKTDIKKRLENEIKLQDYSSKYIITKISLLKPGEFLDDKKTLLDYKLRSCKYHIISIN